MSSKVCQCGVTQIETDRAQGINFCKNCGQVIDNIIEEENEFMETGGGGIQMVGQFVGHDDTRGISGAGMLGLNVRESRQITLQKARRGLMDIASSMRMNQHCIDAAFKIYKLALEYGLSRGNKSSHLLSACLYIICRTEGTQHILLDFCDHVNADISVLARIYLRLARELKINVPHTDPSLLIPRYAAKLEFGDRTNAVANTALRIVQRMKRDWLNIGRRSSGLCGSALLFAARMHNFNRTIQQIVDVVKISKATIVRRLQEFETTPSAQLNMQEFDAIQLESEEDPPAFSKAKRMSKLAQDEEAENIEQIEKEILETQKQIEEQLEKLHKPRGHLAKFAKFVDMEKTVMGAAEDEFINKVLTEKKGKRKKSIDDSEDLDQDEDSSSASIKEKPIDPSPIEDGDLQCAERFIEEQQTQLILSLLTDETEKSNEEIEENDEKEDVKSPRASLATLGLEPLPSTPSSSNQLAKTVTSREPQVYLDFPEWRPSIDLNNDELDLTGIDDNEIDEMILTREETKLKLKTWLRENKDWFLEEKRRQRNKEEAERKKNSISGMNAAQRRKRKKKAAAAQNEANKAGAAAGPMGHYQLNGINLMTPARLGIARSAIEAEKQSQDRRVSTKINYDVLNKLTMKKDVSGATTAASSSSPITTTSDATERTA